MEELPDYTPDNSFVQYMNQAYSRSGAIPSVDGLEKMIQSQLARETDRMFRMKNQVLQRQSLEEGKREFDEQVTQKEYDRYGQSATGLLGSAAQIGTAYMLDDPNHSYAKRKLLGYGGDYGY